MPPPFFSFFSVEYDLTRNSTIGKTLSAAAWQNLRDHVELDCLLLAIAKIGWLTTQGTNGLRLEPGIITLVEGFLRRRPDHGLAGELRAYANDLHSIIAADFDNAA